jgi:sortase (surface protein transpeptidase)
VIRTTSSTKGQGRRLSAALTLFSALITGVVVTASVGTTEAHGSRTGHGRQMPIPVRVVIPSIGVSARIVPVGLNRDHTIRVPKSFAVAAWFRPGPEPGEPGSAVILGHVASRRGPGVFYRLGSLARGSKIVVVLRNGSKVHWVVTGQKHVAKARFPVGLVYKRTPDPTLRIITCSGRFNTSTGHHVDNTIVFASLDRRGRP